MSFDWRNYLSLAEDLITQPKQSAIDPEAYYRAAISRSYYGVYMLTHNFITKHPIYKIQYRNDTKRKGEHQAVRELLMASSDFNEKNIGTQLKVLHERRKNADYKNTPSLNLLDAEIAYNIAQDILQDLKSIGAI